jgi:hypothetical protein
MYRDVYREVLEEFVAEGSRATEFFKATHHMHVVQLTPPDSSRASRLPVRNPDSKRYRKSPRKGGKGWRQGVKGHFLARPVIDSLGRVYPSIKEAAAATGAKIQNIYQVINGLECRKTTRGLGWSTRRRCCESAEPAKKRNSFRAVGSVEPARKPKRLSRSVSIAVDFALTNQADAVQRAGNAKPSTRSKTRIFRLRAEMLSVTSANRHLVRTSTTITQRGWPVDVCALSATAD